MGLFRENIRVCAGECSLKTSTRKKNWTRQSINIWGRGTVEGRRRQPEGKGQNRWYKRKHITRRDLSSPTKKNKSGERGSYEQGIKRFHEEGKGIGKGVTTIGG